jgi:plastocyanin
VTCIRRVIGAGVALVVVVGALPLAACGGGGGDGDDSSGAITVIGDEPTLPPAGEQVIEVKDNMFAPDTVTIKSGTKVIWKWTGTANPHSIQLGGQTSPEQSSGTYERTLSQGGGSFSYQCGIHKEAMAGKIVIE